MTGLGILIAIYLASAIAAVWGTETNRRRLVTVAKPLTTILLFPILGVPSSRFGWAVCAGIALSLGGDVALLWSGDKAFLVGLVLFLLAHVSYIVGFVSVARFSPLTLACICLMGFVTLLLLRKLWKGAAGMHLPVVMYAATITTMVVSAWSTNGGGLPPPASVYATVGALLFYVSDSSLSIDRFGGGIRHASVLTMGVYWLGQLGIALAAR